MCSSPVIAVIHCGKILAEGTLPELADRYQQSDVEELFFDLVQRREDEVAEERKHAGSEVQP